MSKPRYLEIKIPFSGFYHSLYSAEVDSQEEREIQYRFNEENHDDSEMNWPTDLRLSENELGEVFNRNSDYLEAYRAIAGKYVSEFSDQIGEALGIQYKGKRKFYSYAERNWKTEKAICSDLRLEFAEMDSPNEYNFETNRLFAKIPASIVLQLWRIVKEDNFAELRRVCDSRHSSYSGFISGYTRHFEDWGNVLTWDHNQLETLLIAACEIRRADHEDSELSLYYAVAEDSCAWSGCVNWPEVESDILELRKDKLREWHEFDADAVANWAKFNSKNYDLLNGELLGIEPEFRCTKTLDMFLALES